jgi:Xaa-Pro aminopeptidase
VKTKTTIRVLAIAAVVMLSAAPLWAQGLCNPLPDLRTQAEISQQWLKIRLEQVLPALMREHGVAMWIVPMREYNEDPVFTSLVSPTTFAARRRTIFVFFDRGVEAGVERLALGGGSHGGLYTTVRDTTLPAGAELWGDAQWKLLARIVRERNPRNIAVNISRVHAFSDGLSAGEWEQLQEALGEDTVKRIVRAERLPLDFISVRIPEMLPTYRQMMSVVHELIAEAFSRNVITPGVTTTEDVVWWFRQTMHDLGFGTWFQPSVDVQRRGTKPAGSPVVIERGDLLHCDIGITAMRLHTDTQHMGYVLREGETDAPEGLKNALRASNRLQDIVMESIRVGATGNEILAEALKKMKEEGIDGSVYSHPVGQHGHGAGPLIGLWDRQQDVPGRGDVPVRKNTWFSIELQVSSAVPEWDGQKVTSSQEEDACVDENGHLSWVLRRQSSFHLVR